MNDIKTGLSTCSKKIDSELFENYKTAGIELAEISIGLEASENFDFKSAKKQADAAGVGIWSFHLPFSPFEIIDISKPELAKSTQNRLIPLIQKSGEAGIEKCIIHASGEPIDEAERPLRMETAKESLFVLAEKAAAYGVTICVEDLPRTCLGRNSDDIKELISAHNALRVCFDTNHLLSEPIPHFIETVGDKIVTTHISDYDFIDERHRLPGDGLINWPELCDSLRSIGYKGPWLYEISLNPTDANGNKKQLTFADFTENRKKYCTI